MKISEITDAQINEYCGMPEGVTILPVYKTAAIEFIKGYTGLTDEEINEHEDITIAFCVLVNEMSFNRDYTVNKSNINPCVQTILSMYSKNYL